MELKEITKKTIGLTKKFPKKWNKDIRFIDLIEKILEKRIEKGEFNFN